MNLGSKNAWREAGFEIVAFGETIPEMGWSVAWYNRSASGIFCNRRYVLDFVNNEYNVESFVRSGLTLKEAVLAQMAIEKL